MKPATCKSLHHAGYEIVEENCQQSDNHNVPAEIEVNFSPLHVFMTDFL